jgi:hypothetical protein
MAGLQMAATHGYLPIVQFLLSQKVSIDILAVFHAAQSGYPEIVELLLDTENLNPFSVLNTLVDNYREEIETGPRAGDRLRTIHILLGKCSVNQIDISTLWMKLARLLR